MSPTDATRGSSGSTAATPLHPFLSHTSDLGTPDEPGSFVAAAVEAVLRARHAVTDVAYFAARETSSAGIVGRASTLSGYHARRQRRRPSQPVGGNRCREKDESLPRGGRDSLSG